MSDSSGKKARPLSPHLQIYKPQMTSGMSIFHRITGVGLAFGLVAFVAWLAALTQGPETYARFIQCAHSPVAQIFLFGWIWAFFFHLCSGIRHLLWDAGLFLDIKNVYRTGYSALAVSTLMTLMAWYQILWSGQ